MHGILSITRAVSAESARSTSGRSQHVCHGSLAMLRSKVSASVLGTTSMAKDGEGRWYRKVLN
jgi:hypothetical protein